MYADGSEDLKRCGAENQQPLDFRRSATFEQMAAFGKSQMAAERLTWGRCTNPLRGRGAGGAVMLVYWRSE
jgi:hypothetical protein